MGQPLTQAQSADTRAGRTRHRGWIWVEDGVRGDRYHLPLPKIPALSDRVRVAWSECAGRVGTIKPIGVEVLGVFFLLLDNVVNRAVY